MQRLLNHYGWDAGAVRDALARYVVAGAGDPGGVLVPDGSGFVKRGRRSAGVQRQYTGTAGRTEDSQAGMTTPHDLTSQRHGIFTTSPYWPPRSVAVRAEAFGRHRRPSHPGRPH